MDLGQKYKIDRIIFYPEPPYEQYADYCPKVFELWGRTNNDIKNAKPYPYNSSWHKYGRFKLLPPPNTPISESETIPYPQNGVEFKITNPNNQPPVKYLKFVVITNYFGAPGFYSDGIKIFGAPVK